MIQSWIKTYEDGKVKWDKVIIGASSANNIVVTNPEITNTPATLNSVLGAFKSNIDELYSNVKWLALHGGGGAGGTGGGGGSSYGDPYLSISGRKDGATKDITNSIVQVNTTSYSFSISIYNADSDTEYYVTVRDEENDVVYVNRSRLTRTSNTITVTIEGITEGKNVPLSISCQTDEGTRLRGVSLNISYAAVHITANLEVSPGNIIPIANNGQASKEMDSNGYILLTYLSPTVAGTVEYDIETTIRKADGTYLSITGRQENVASGGNVSIRKNLQTLSGGNMIMGRPYKVNISASVKSVIDGQEVTRATGKFSFQAVVNSPDAIYITYIDQNWQYIDNQYTDNYFQNGNNASLSTTIIAPLTGNFYRDIYYIVKFYYGTIGPDGEEEWHPLTSSVLNYGYLKDNDDSTPDFVTTNIPTDRNQYRQWITNNSAALMEWQNANASRSVTITSAGGVERSITVPYNVIADNMFVHTKEGLTDKFAHIRADFFIINIGTNAGTDQIILPYQYNESGDLVENPYLSLKTEIMKSAQSIPSYVTGLQSGSLDEETGGYTYWQDNMRLFNFDSIHEPTYESIKNDDDVPVFVFAQEFGESEDGVTPRVSIPMDMYHINGTNSGLVTTTRTSYINSKKMKSNGNVVTNSYRALRFSGKSYGQITKREFAKFFNIYGTDINWRSATMKSGYTVELVFNSDWHPNSDGVIFSMCDYDNSGNMTTGIEVSLESASFRIGNGTSTEVANVTLIQNTFTQLDFVFETVNNGNGTLTGIAKIYVNGICTGITSLTLTEGAAGLSLVGPELNNGVTFGCASNMTQHTDVDFYGIRFYKQKLSDYEILKNWLITYSVGNKGADGGVDWDNVINPALKRNYFDDEWASILWDYTAGTDANGNYIGHKASSGQKLFEAMSAWLSREIKNPLTGDVTTEMYRPMPVILLGPGTGENFGKSSDLFYSTYNEATAAVNNGYITQGENTGNFNSCFQGSFEYYDVNHEAAIVAPFNVAWYMQGTSTQAYRSKNIELCFTNEETAAGDLDGRNNNHILFTPDPKNWLPENRFTLKADVMDSAHANNAAIGRWINRSNFMPLNPAQQDETNLYKDKIKSTLEGFPVLVFVNWGYGIDQQISGYQFLGIYSFNLGRGSYFNLGFKKIEKYELVEGASSATDDDVDAWTDVSKVDHASFVKRYKMPAQQNTNIYSFECTTNTPSQAAGLQQPNMDLMKKVWDLKWTSNPSPENGYRRLKTLVNTLGYCDGDTLGGRSHVPTYYYGINGADIGPLEIYRNPENGKISLAPQDGWVKDLCKWYEGLQLLEGVTGLTFDNEGNYVSGNVPDKRQIDKLSINFTVNDGDASYTPSVDRAPLMSENNTSIIHYGSFSRYFVVAILFGMIDSLGKNMTLRSWNLETDQNASKGTFVPAFYDMDTALGIDNAGLEKVDPTAYIDYWINNNVNTATGVELKVFTESYPYTTRDIYYDNSGNPVYNWYDKDPREGGKLIAQYGVNDPQPPIPDNVIYDIIDSHFWHLIRFMPSIARPVLNNYDTNVVMSWAPIGQYAILRSKFLADVNDFIDNYFLEHNANVGEFIFNLDYKEKYQTPYVKADSVNKEMTYDDMKFCHGRRDNYVRHWMKKRISFLDSVFNLGRMYKPSSINNNGEVPEFEWAADGEVNYFNANDSDVIALGARRDDDNNWISNYMHELSTKSEASKVGYYSFVITSNSTVVLVISISNKQYRYLLREGIPEYIRMSPNDGQYSININNTDCISDWVNIKDLRFTQFNQKWNLLNLNLAGQDSVESGSSSDFSLTSMKELRTLDLSNFHTRSMSSIERIDLSGLKKLQELHIDNSDIAGVSLPEGGNLVTLTLKDCQKINGKLEIKNMTSLEGVIDISGCMNITDLIIENCPKLSGVAFGSNIALKNIEIHNCPGMTSFSYSGRNDARYQNSTYTNVMKSISFTGNCHSLSSISIEYVSDPNFVMDFSGATGLSSLSLSNIATINMPILPAYYDDKGDRSADLIYNNDEVGFTLSLTSVNFPSLLYGTGNNALVGYISNRGNAEKYPEIYTISYAEYLAGSAVDGTKYIINDVAPNGGLILNLSVFKKIATVYIQDCQYVEYIACRFDKENPVSNIGLQRVNNLKRIFGYIGIGSESFDRGLSSFVISEWNQYPIKYSNSMMEIKNLYEAAINSETNSQYESYLAQIEELMHDIDPNIEEPVQGIVPATRLFVNSDVKDFNRTFRSTGISMNDLYYIMLLINMYNKDKKIVTSMNATFSGCSNIVSDWNSVVRDSQQENQNPEEGESQEGTNTGDTTNDENEDLTIEYDQSTDRSPSRFLFKYLYTLTSVQNMFAGCSMMKGILYSPDHVNYVNITKSSEFANYIGTLTPLAKNCSNMTSIGWQVDLADDYTFWVPDQSEGIGAYYDPSNIYKGSFEKLENVQSIRNNTNCVMSAVYGYINLDKTYFIASKLMRSFKKAKKVTNSFNGIYVYMDNVVEEGCTYNEMFKDCTELLQIENSYNFSVEKDSVIVDLFGSSKNLRIKYPVGSYFPSKITTILASFTMTNMNLDNMSYFVLTDDMFQRFASTLVSVAPNIEPDNTLNAADAVNGMFCGFGVRKTYVKFDSDTNTEDRAFFPYGVFANCTNLVNIPGFFTGLDMRNVVNMKNKSSDTLLTAEIINTEYETFVRSGDNPLNIPLPNYYSSAPYVEKIAMDGTVEKTASLRMFKDTVNLVNMSSAFRFMIPPYETVGSGYIPGGFVLVEEGFKGLKKLRDLSYAFADNHYFRGSIPLKFLYTGDNDQNVSYKGFNDASFVKYGFLGVDISTTGFAGMTNLSQIKSLMESGDVNLGSAVRGILLEAQVYGGYCYVPDDYATENVYVIDYNLQDNANVDSVNSTNDFNTLTHPSTGELYPAYVRFDNTIPWHHHVQRYRRENVFEWWQRLESTGETREPSTAEDTISVPNKQIRSIERIFSRNDAAGWLPLRYSDEPEYSAIGIRSSTLMYNEDNFAKSELYKWNAYKKDDYLKVNGRYKNTNLYANNPNYNPFKFVLNPKYDPRKKIRIKWADVTEEAKVWRYVYKNAIDNYPNPNEPEVSAVRSAIGTTSSSTSNSTYTTWIREAFTAASSANTSIYDYPQLKGKPVYQVNYDYDPRYVIFNENLNKISFNKHVYDGVKFTDSEKEQLITDAAEFILDGNIGTDVYPSNVSDSVKRGIVERQIPEHWNNLRTPIENPKISSEIDNTSVTNTNIGVTFQMCNWETDGNYAQITPFEVEMINHIKAEKRYFCPSDIFNYVGGSIKYAFYETSFQCAKVDPGKTLNVDYASINDPAWLELLKIDHFRKTIVDLGVNKEYYPEGNMYTGIPGKISPVIFEDANTFSSIEGVFAKNPQFFPYTYSGELNNVTVLGDLFDINTFKPLTNLVDSYLLWSKNIVPRGVRISPDTFKYNTSIHYSDFMFGGTIWYGTHEDDRQLGYQLQEHTFDSQQLVIANGMFVSLINYIEPTFSTSANLVIQQLMNQDPRGYMNGEIPDVGEYCVRHVPADIFVNSFDTLRQCHHIFYYCRNLKNFPNIYFYKYFSPLNSTESGYKSKLWNTRLFHAAFFLNSSVLESSSYNKLSIGGPWELRDEGEEPVNMTNYVSCFNVSWNPKVNNNMPAE